MTQEQINGLLQLGFSDAQISAMSQAADSQGGVVGVTTPPGTTALGEQSPGQMYPGTQFAGNSALMNTMDVLFPGYAGSSQYTPSQAYVRRITSSANANAYNAAKDLQATKYQEAQARLGQNKLKQTELQLKVDRGIATPDDVSQLESLNSSIQQDEAVSANLTQEQIDAANADGQKAAEARAARAAKAGQVVGKAASVVNSVVGTADKLMTQDLKMDETSNMIDAGVDTVSNGLMASGNPYAMAAAAALKAVNFADKAFGSKVEGFHVNLDTNSYGSGLGHFEESSGRSWQRGAQERKNERRNAQAEMAMKAKNLVEDAKFEQKARQASLNDVMLANQLALAGGVDTSILAAKHGARLKSMSDYVIARRKKLAEDKKHSLEGVQTGKEPNVIPEGALHKNKNHIDLEDITKKGIPVISTEGTPTTLEEIKQKGGEIVQHAEIEENELILNLSLTKKLEYCRDKYDETKDDKYLIYAGKLLCKELMSNTEDNTGLINDLEDKQ